jgi:MOSC domain-containing protein YiiM
METSIPAGPRLLSVNIGKVRMLVAGARTVPSGFRRSPVPGVIPVGLQGLDGDEHADLKVHGGIDKAVYACPVEHYPFWQQQRREQGVGLPGESLAPGFLGENLTVSGLMENSVWIGDELHFPDCVLRVTMPRQPCFKFNAVLGFAQAARTLMQAGVSGFYLAVQVPGSICAGQAVRLVAGPRTQSVAQCLDELRVKWRLKVPGEPVDP